MTTLAYRVGQQGNGLECHLVVLVYDDETAFAMVPIAQCSRKPAEVQVELKIKLPAGVHRHPVIQAVLNMVTCERCRGFLRDDEAKARREPTSAPKWDRHRPEGCTCRWDMLGVIKSSLCPVHGPELQASRGGA